MTTVAHEHEIGAIRAVIEDTVTLQSDAEGFARLLTEDVVRPARSGWHAGGARRLRRDVARSCR